MTCTDTVRVAGAALLALTIDVASAQAHEFWIAPLDGRVDVGGEIVGDLKVGRQLRGESYPYLSDRFQSFTITDGETVADVAGNEGDIPALSHVAERPGLHVIAQETIAFRVTYDDWEMFGRYLTDEGLESFAEIHRARGLPESGFAERYIRCAKALVQVGPINPEDRDIRVGLPLELVAEANPYGTGVDSLPVTLTWRGEPVANRQINIFHDDGTVTRSAVTTDQHGRAQIPLSGNGEYLLNAVHLREADAAAVVWASHWATLSFKL